MNKFLGIVTALSVVFTLGAVAIWAINKQFEKFAAELFVNCRKRGICPVCSFHNHAFLDGCRFPVPEHDCVNVTPKIPKKTPYWCKR